MSVLRFLASLVIAIGIVSGVSVFFPLIDEIGKVSLSDKASEIARISTGTPQAFVESASSTPPALSVKKAPVATTTPAAIAKKEPAKTVPPKPPAKVTTVATSSDSGPEKEALLNEAEIIRLTNVERTSRGLSPLSWDPALAAMARAKAKDMLDRQYFAHESPDGVDVAGLAVRFSYVYRFVGENLAEGDFYTNSGLIEGWMNSPGHRENILSGNYTEMGAAAIFGTYEGRPAWMAVQEFGKPLPLCAKPSAELKAAIDLKDAEIRQLGEAIAALEETIKAGGENKNQHIASYNTLVELHNKILTELKSLITDYNVSVNAYNACTDT